MFTPCPFDFSCATIPCMSVRFKPIVSIFFTLLVGLLVFVMDAAGQAGYTVRLSSLDVSKFPHLNAFLDVHDPGGGFVHGLTPQDVFMLENGVQVPLTMLQEQKPGVQFVMAISPGASFGIRDGLGISRYDYLLKATLAGTWVNQAEGMDDFSLLTQGGPQLTHSTDPAALHSALEAFQPDSTNTAPSLDVLASALQVASDPLLRPGMKRSILFITSPLETDVSLGIQSIVASAAQQDIHISVWVLTSQDAFELPQIDQLRALAEQTQGAFFAFSHEEPVPDLETILEPLRYVYKIGYDSQITTAGTQQVLAQVIIGGEQITTQPTAFELNLLPPVPALLNPPSEIIRQFSEQPTQANKEVAEILLPVEQILTIQVTFPDGYKHQLSRTSLYVDGAITAENTSAPFNQFFWDLRPYTQDGVHTLSVEVTDSLGLSGKTDDIPIEIAVPSTTLGMINAVSNNRLLVIGVTVFISAAILVLVLILGGRIHPKPYPGQVIPQANSNGKTALFRFRERKRILKDPVTQPVRIKTVTEANSKSRVTKWAENLPWKKHKEKPVEPKAYLVPLLEPNEATIPVALPLAAEDITLGSDPRRAKLVIIDASIQGLHARIHHDGKGYLLTDAGSVAGTWMNYEQVTAEGKILKHGDIIHLGHIGFRFNLAEPGQSRKVVITPLEREQ
jgi:hypothetical protein